MKIYKLSQEIIDLDQGRRHNSYLDVGHFKGFEDEDSWELPCIWLWSKGRLIVEKATEKYYGHDEFLKKHLNDIPELDGKVNYSKNYMGRFDPNTKEISISIPIDYRTREVPNTLLKQLIGKFNPKKIIYF